MIFVGEICIVQNSLEKIFKKKLRNNMRKIIVLSMITLDGVMQAPGGPEEDTSGGFKYGGWVAPYGDEVYGKVMEKQMKPADLLLGRKTFEIFADYWPEHENGWPGINDGHKIRHVQDHEKVRLEKLSFPQKPGRYQKAQKFKRF